jgi:hypothetical protein
VRCNARISEVSSNEPPSSDSLALPLSEPGLPLERQNAHHRQDGQLFQLAQLGIAVTTVDDAGRDQVVFLAVVRRLDLSKRRVMNLRAYSLKASFSDMPALTQSMTCAKRGATSSIFSLCNFQQ